MKKNVSLKDIATKVGVSTALVSYVLNNKMEGRINKEMAARIKAVAEELNYRPNQIARSLKTSKTATIGLLLADISNPFSSQIARIVENEANKYGYTVIMGSSDENADKTSDLIQLFLNRQVDGLILSLPENTENEVLYLKKHGVPFVLLDRYFPTIPTNVVAVDNFSASRSAIQHLMENGHKHIGVVSYKTNLHHLNERLKGAVNLLEDKSLVGEIRLDNIDEDVAAAIDHFLAQPNPASAIFFTSNLLTLSGLKYLNKIGVRIPDQLSVVAFDKTDAFELFYTTISYVSQPMTELGETAVSLLRKSIEDGKHLEQVLLSTELNILKSSVSH
jgi:LacI family transcriptional regulator